MKLQAIAIILSLITLIGCGELKDGDSNFESKNNDMTFSSKYTSLYAIKRIDSSINQGHAEHTFSQSSYPISSSSRLLLRLESFLSIVPEAVIDDEHKVFFQVTPVSKHPSEFWGQVKICPLTKQWMMLATWNKAHPFPGGSGDWAYSGGDFDSYNCISAQHPSGVETHEHIYFDISSWVTNYKQGGGSNHGWILISNIPATIYGDQSKINPPKISWVVRD